MDKKFLFLFLFLLVVPLVYAGEFPDPTFQVNTKAEIIRACSDRGFPCGSNFECNLTLSYPNGEIMLDSQKMTNNGSYRNITIPQGLNNKLGYHQAIMTCNNVSNAGTDIFNVVVTADGEPYQTIPFKFLLIVFGFLLMVPGLISKDLTIFKWIGAVVVFISGVLTLYPGYSFVNWSTLAGKTIGVVSIGGGFFLLIMDSFSRDKQVERFSQTDDGRFHG